MPLPLFIYWFFVIVFVLNLVIFLFWEKFADKNNLVVHFISIATAILIFGTFVQAAHIAGNYTDNEILGYTAGLGAAVAQIIAIIAVRLIVVRLWPPKTNSALDEDVPDLK